MDAACKSLTITFFKFVPNGNFKLNLCPLCQLANNQRLNQISKAFLILHKFCRIFPIRSFNGMVSINLLFFQLQAAEVQLVPRGV